jgi:acetamidase/formamidase
MAEHTIDPNRIHHEWDLSLEPTLEIVSGDVVHFDLPMAGRGQVSLGARYEETAFDLDTIYNLLGPIRVEGAEPGDTLEVEILSLAPGSWGWTAFLPDLGLLPEDFPNPYLRTFEIDGASVEVVPGIRVPCEPFLGTMGNHPAVPERNVPFPPHRGGGNMDNRHLVAGATVSLPVWCPGALFSCGDPHALQGDGEVCVAALECDMRATLRFHLHKRSLPAPMFTSPPPTRDAGGTVGTMGIDPDLMQGAKTAVRAMIDWLVAEHPLTREDAYVLCSLAGDLKIHEIVDAGVWTVGFTLPRSIFPH